MSTPERNNGLWNPVCAYCCEKYYPDTKDGIGLCGFCRHQRAKIVQRLRAMVDVLNASLVDAIERLEEGDNERYSTYYHAYRSATPDTRESLQRKADRSIAAGGKFGEAIKLHRQLTTAQARYVQITTLYEAIP